MTSPILLVVVVEPCSVTCKESTFSYGTFSEFVVVIVGVVIIGVVDVVVDVEEDETMVIQSVVGNDPVFNNFDPIKALMTVDLPALYSPAMTMTTVF